MVAGLCPVFLTPDQKPFYIGTYFPKQSRYGIPGFSTILETLAHAYQNKKEDINKVTKELMDSLIESSSSVLVNNSKDRN